VKSVLLGVTLLSLIVGAGCGKPGMSSSESSGNVVTLSQDGKNATVLDTKGGEASETGHRKGTVVSESKVNLGGAGTTLSEAELGLPFYPGSVEEPGRSVDMSRAGETTVSSARTTKDDPEAVTKFYKDKVSDPQPTAVNSGNSKMATVNGSLKDGGEVSVIATRRGAEDTEILVMVRRKK
jgi:hypothetical protein